MTRELQKALETALEADMIRAPKLGLVLDRRRRCRDNGCGSSLLGVE